MLLLNLPILHQGVTSFIILPLDTIKDMFFETPQTNVFPHQFTKGLCWSPTSPTYWTCDPSVHCTRLVSSHVKNVRDGNRVGFPLTCANSKLTPSKPNQTHYGSMIFKYQICPMTSHWYLTPNPPLWRVKIKLINCGYNIPSKGDQTLDLKVKH